MASFVSKFDGFSLFWRSLRKMSARVRVIGGGCSRYPNRSNIRGFRRSLGFGRYAAKGALTAAKKKSCDHFHAFNASAAVRVQSDQERRPMSDDEIVVRRIGNAPPRPVMTQLLLLLSTGAPPRDGAL